MIYLFYLFSVSRDVGGTSVGDIIICIMRGVAETHRLRSYRGIVSSVNGRELLALGGLILSTWVTVGATSVAFTSR